MGKKYICVLGGCLSSLGKGVLSSSIGALLETCANKKVAMVKCDPYLNVSADTLRPTEHGESFVLDDGWCADLDLGNYRRFTHSNLSKANSITSGQVFAQVLENEKKGMYLGKTIQFIPHITNEIKRRITEASSDPESITVVEIGGTVGDLESQVYVEAVRQLADELNTPTEKNVLVVYLTLIMRMPNGEIKTKPAQHSVSELTEAGIKPDVLVCREKELLSNEILSKLETFCGVPRSRIFTSVDVSSVYLLPAEFKKQGLDKLILNQLGLKDTTSDKTTYWDDLVQKLDKINKQQRAAKVAIVGKYISNPDSYKSVEEALYSACVANGVQLDLSYIDSVQLEKTPEHLFKSTLRGFDGILIPGGFGSSGIEGMIRACKYARENNIAYFGICLGMQILVIEYARNVLGLKNANSTEIDPNTENPVISLLPEQQNIQYYGETMRLGVTRSVIDLSRETAITKAYVESKVIPLDLRKEDVLSASFYKIDEIHRHKYEVNQNFKDKLKNGGLILETIYTPRDGFNLTESAEYSNGRGFGVQFHPEFKSRMFEPHPLFNYFIKRCLDCHEKVTTSITTNEVK